MRSILQIADDDTARSRRGLQAATGLPAVAKLPTQIVALQAGLRELQTLSGHPDRRPREAR
jgi:hypothetical protein